MDLLEFLIFLKERVLGTPSVFIFLFVGVYLTIKTRFLQIRGIPRFFSFLKGGMKKTEGGNIKTINSLHAMFAAMATSLGMGNIVGPSIAIIWGGPGALFWLIIYNFFGGILRFTETTFALHTRKKTEDGSIISGPTQYLKLVSKWVANWYGVIMIVVFAVWSGVQSNTLAKILAKENVPEWSVGLALAIIVLIILHGGAKRVGFVASKLVPIMCFLYLSFSLLIIFKDITALKNAINLIFSSIFRSSSAVGGFLGATVLAAMREGIFRSIYITEAGLGTSSIPHSMSDVKKPTDQGLLAMYSIFADSFISFISGLLVIVSGMWMVGGFTPTLIYDAFKFNLPLAVQSLGQFVLVISISLFVITTVIGNSFNGLQSFASFTKHRWNSFYKLFTAAFIFSSALFSAPLMWAMVDLAIIFVAVPNVISLAILAFKKPEVMKIES